MPNPMEAMMGFFTKPNANGVNTSGQSVASPPNGQQQQSGQGNQPNPNAIDPNNPNSQGTSDPNKLQGPEALYKDLFNDPVGDGNVDVAPEYKIDPNHLKKVSDSLDFSRDMPAEIMEKLQSGEQLSGQDFVAAINHVGRRVYATAMEHQSSVTGKYVDLHSKHSLKGLPSEIRKHMTMSQIQSDPAASNPVVQEHMMVVAERLQKRYPDASPDWIKQQTRDYFLNMAKMSNPDAFNNESNPGSGNKPPEKMDWDAFMKI